jgi:hypothetical protein
MPFSIMWMKHVLSEEMDIFTSYNVLPICQIYLVHQKSWIMRRQFVQRFNIQRLHKI